MVLIVCVNGIVVITHVAIFIIILPCVIIFPVFVILLNVDAVPCYAAPLVAHQPSHPEGVALVHPAQHHECRLRFNFRITNVTIGIPS